MSSGKKILLAFECRQPQFSSSIRLGARADSRIVSKSEKKTNFTTHFCDRLTKVNIRKIESSSSFIKHTISLEPSEAHCSFDVLVESILFFGYLRLLTVQISTWSH